jgi:hypothetical protein
MKDKTREKEFPVPAAERARAPRTMLHLSVGPSPTLVQFLKEHPGAKILIPSRNRPAEPSTGRTIDLPAFEVEMYRRDSHACPHCQRSFSVKYSSVHYGKPTPCNISVPCFWCTKPVGVPVPDGVDRGGVIVGKALTD